MAAPGAGVPPVPGGNAGQIAAALAAQHAARKGRLKQSFTFLTCSHISDSSTLELLGDPLSPMFHNGPDAYDWIMQQVIKPPSTVDLQDMTIEFWLIEIITGVGISDNSIADSIKMLRVVNAEFPLARRFKELDAVEGVPGTPGVRQFQLAAPAAGGPRPRDLNGIIVFWQESRLLEDGVLEAVRHPDERGVIAHFDGELSSADERGVIAHFDGELSSAVAIGGRAGKLRTASKSPVGSRHGAPCKRAKPSSRSSSTIMW